MKYTIAFFLGMLLMGCGSEPSKPDEPVRLLAASADTSTCKVLRVIYENARHFHGKEQAVFTDALDDTRDAGGNTFQIIENNVDPREGASLVGNALLCPSIPSQPVPVAPPVPPTS